MATKREWSLEKENNLTPLYFPHAVGLIKVADLINPHTRYPFSKVRSLMETFFSSKIPVLVRDGGLILLTVVYDGSSYERFKRIVEDNSLPFALGASQESHRCPVIIGNNFYNCGSPATISAYRGFFSDLTIETGSSPPIYVLDEEGSIKGSKGAGLRLVPENELLEYLTLHHDNQEECVRQTLEISGELYLGKPKRFLGEVRLIKLDVNGFSRYLNGGNENIFIEMSRFFYALQNSVNSSDSGVKVIENTGESIILAIPPTISFFKKLLESIKELKKNFSSFTVKTVVSDSYYITGYITGEGNNNFMPFVLPLLNLEGISQAERQVKEDMNRRFGHFFTISVVNRRFWYD